MGSPLPLPLPALRAVALSPAMRVCFEQEKESTEQSNLDRMNRINRIFILLFQKTTILEIL
jgi:hypothetical protein